MTASASGSCCRARAPEAWPDRTIYRQNHRGDTPQLNRNASAQTQAWKIVQPLGKSNDPMAPRAEFELYEMSADHGETNNFAGEHPEIVKRTKRGYEEWFRDVSSGGIEPARIYLGSPREPRTTLSRSDWPGDCDDRAGAGAPGYWPVAIERRGRYDLTLRFAGRLPADGRARLAIRGVEAAQSVAAGGASCELPSTELEAGPTRRLRRSARECRLHRRQIRRTGIRTIRPRVVSSAFEPLCAASSSGSQPDLQVAGAKALSSQPSAAGSGARARIGPLVQVLVAYCPCQVFPTCSKSGRESKTDTPMF